MRDEVVQAIADAISLASRKLGGKGALAKQLGCSTESLRRWASGEREPSLSIAVAIFEAAGRPIMGSRGSVEARLTSLEVVVANAVSVGSQSVATGYGFSHQSMEANYRDLIEGLAAIERASPVNNEAPTKIDRRMGNA